MGHVSYIIVAEDDAERSSVERMSPDDEYVSGPFQDWVAMLFRV